MDYLLAAALGAALGAIAPYLERKIVPMIGFVAVLAAAAWFVVTSFDGPVGLVFGLVAVTISAGLGWVRDKRRKTRDAEEPAVPQTSVAS